MGEGDAFYFLICLIYFEEKKKGGKGGEKAAGRNKVEKKILSRKRLCIKYGRTRMN